MNFISAAIFEVFTAVKIEFMDSGLLLRVVSWLDTNVSEDRGSSIFTGLKCVASMSLCN